MAFLLILQGFPATGQHSHDKIIAQVLRQLEIDSASTLPHLITSREFGKETLVVIPEIVEEEPGLAIFDAHLLLVDSKTGKPRATYHGSKNWYSDAVRLTDIEIESKPYQLGSEKAAYVVLLHYEGSSRPNPYNATELTLFVIDGGKLQRVLQDYRISYLNAETDMNCNSEFVRHTKTLKIDNGSDKAYPDLIVTDFIESGISTEENCKPVTTHTEEKTEVLTFQQGKYKSIRVP